MWTKSVKEHKDVERENTKMKEEVKMAKDKNEEINVATEELEKIRSEQFEDLGKSSLRTQEILEVGLLYREGEPV